MGCDKDYKLYSKGSIQGQIHYGPLKKLETGNYYADHEHINLCSKCSINVIKLLKDTYGNRWR